MPSLMKDSSAITSPSPTGRPVVRPTTIVEMSERVVNSPSVTSR